MFIKLLPLLGPNLKIIGVCYYANELEEEKKDTDIDP